MRSVLTQELSDLQLPGKSPSQVKAHNSDPGKHGHGGEIAKVTECCTQPRTVDTSVVEDDDDVDGDEGAGDDVHRDDLAVQVPEAGQQPVDDEGEKEAEKTDCSSDGVENRVGLTLVPIVPEMQVSILVNWGPQGRWWNDGGLSLLTTFLKVKFPRAVTFSSLSRSIVSTRFVLFDPTMHRSAIFPTTSSKGER